MMLPPRQASSFPLLQTLYRMGLQHPWVGWEAPEVAGAFSWMLRRLMESFCAAGQETERCYITEIPNAASPSDLDPWTHGCHGEKGGRIMFSLLAARQRQHLVLRAPDSAKLRFHHLTAYMASPRRHTKINAHRFLSQEFINSFKGQGLIFHFL